ncbi:AAA family ATPase [Alkaliphilus pronyensis]|uniref:AAA family ATPase n=1 Tax=Alkaliphilus pronyensis TaxID=1482732 RepID=A0A6I0EZ28_9FIRM|nr:AAA family ATPase [Alkaliphilus pronyensis]KAB3534389.1 AAA family ATPase [Alkaliphilus pronyensis]
MRLIELNINSFGRFINETPMVGLPNSFVLFYGKNESGKTTLFHLIKSLLYGFTPANRDQHPYNPWEVDKIDFSGRLRLDNGEEIEITRKLLSTPRGQLLQGNNAIDLRNKPLPYVNHISTEIYEKIYSLRVEDLVQLQGKGWDEIQDKLLANYGSHLIRNTREVLKELQEEANSVYRESGRGGFLIKKLEGEIKSLKKERLEAIKRQQDIRENQQRLEVINNLIEEKSLERIKLKQLTAKVKKLIPLKGLLKDLEATSNSFINKDIYDDLPKNPLEKRDELNELVNQLNDFIEDKQRMINLKSNKVSDVTDYEKQILHSKDEINEYVKNAGRIQYMRDSVEKLKTEINIINERIKYEGKKLLNEEVNNEILASIEGLSLSQTKIAYEDYRKVKADIDDATKSYEFLSNQSINFKIPSFYVISAIAGTIIAAVGYGLNASIITFLGVVIGVFGGGGYVTSKLLKNQLYKQKNDDAQIKALQKKLEEATIKLANAKEALFSLFRGIPLPEVVILNIDEMVLSGIIKIKDDIYQLNEKQKLLKEKEGSLNKEVEGLQNFLNTLEITDTNENSLYSLKEQLDGVQKKLLVNDGLIEELEALKEEESSLNKKLQEVLKLLADIEEKLKILGNGDIEKGVEIFQLNNKLELKLRLIEEKLMEWSNIEEQKKELNQLENNEGWIFQDLQLEKTELVMEELEEKLQELRDEKKEKQLAIDNLLNSITIDDIESQLLMIQSDYEMACIKRDKLALLTEIIKKAEEEFREENQPDVLKNASHYFNIITNGRYSNIYVEETDEGTCIMVKKAGVLAAQQVTESFSKGTLNQLYLSLRLSLMDHLDKGFEKLPVCFDELFINWDKERLENNFKLLKEISHNRQIFFFTCHNWLAEQIENTFNTTRISL